MNKDIANTLKFADFLSGKGLLKPVVNAYKEFRSLENFPFTLRDKRVFRAAILKALCQRNDLTIEEIELLTDKWTEEMYEAYPTKKVGNEIEALIKKHKIPKEFKETVAYMSETLDKKNFAVWLKNAAENFKEREIAETATPEQLKEIQEKAKNKELGDKLNAIATEEMKKKSKAKKLAIKK